MWTEKLEKLQVLIGGSSPPELLIWAPLRICPLGAHVDHQGGVVSGMSVDRGVLLAGRPATEVRLQSLEMGGEVRLDPQQVPPDPQGNWGDYPRAALAVLQKKFLIRRGFDAVLSGDLPGMGLSSSAALLTSLLMALAAVNELKLGRKEIARLVQEAENSHLGLSSGLLDPSIILFAGEGCLTRIDCSNFDVENIPFPAAAPPLEIVVAFSGLSRQLLSSSYNSRVVQCHEAARIMLGEDIQEERARLSMVSRARFEEMTPQLPKTLEKRAAHYFGEVRRVELGCSAWARGDLEAFGKLVNLSGLSSVENYESGTPGLVTLDRLLRESPGVYGSRFSGGGFGGCCIALTRPGFGAEVIAGVSAAYAQSHPEASSKSAFTICRLSGPARVLAGRS